MRVAAVQMTPVLLNREATMARVVAWAERAADDGAQLIAFPEAIVPGYPTWIARTGGAAFDDPDQKALHAAYIDQSLECPGTQFDALRELSSDRGVSLVVGVMERGTDTARGTLYCTALTIHPDGTWWTHRKLVPTYEERLAWGPGDGHGLRVGACGEWRVGALSCWENWMPAARFALYAQGEDVHVSTWPGSAQLTTDISRFTAREGRVYVVASSGVLKVDDLPNDLPLRDELIASAPDGVLHSGGSRIVAPTGEVVASLDTVEEGLVVADLDRRVLLGERQNFDCTGHYFRPDVFELRVNRARREGVVFEET